MKIIINSHIKSDIALNHLLQSIMMYEEYNKYDIIIAIGGYYDLIDYKIEKTNNITKILCNHNSIDFTAFISMVELDNIFNNFQEYYLYLHDTCKIGPNFFNKLNSINYSNVTTIRINRDFSMNIGIYKLEILHKFKSFLLSIKNNDDSKLIYFKNLNILIEDYIFKNDKNNIILDNYNGHNYYGPTDYYNTGVMRIVEYYPNIDLYKIKANWCKKDIWELKN